MGREEPYDGRADERLASQTSTICTDCRQDGLGCIFGLAIMKVLNYRCDNNIRNGIPSSGLANDRSRVIITLEAEHNYEDVISLAFAVIFTPPDILATAGQRPR